MAAGFFKAHCLAVIDEVQAKRETVVIMPHDVGPAAAFGESVYEPPKPTDLAASLTLIDLP